MLWLRQEDAVLKRRVLVLKLSVARMVSVFAMEIAVKMEIAVVARKNVAKNVTARSNFF